MYSRLKLKRPQAVKAFRDVLDELYATAPGNGVNENDILRSRL